MLVRKYVCPRNHSWCTELDARASTPRSQIATSYLVLLVMLWTAGSVVEGADGDGTAGQRHLCEQWSSGGTAALTEDTWHLSLFWRRKNRRTLVLLAGRATSYMPTWSSALLAIEKHCRSLSEVEIRYQWWEAEIFLQGFFSTAESGKA